MANVISGVPTMVGRDQCAKAMANDASLSGGKSYFTYFAIGEAGYIQSGSVKVPKDPTSNRSRMDSQGKRLSGLFTWTDGSTAVTATSADFVGDGLTAGKWVRPDSSLMGRWYQVAEVVSTSELRLGEAFVGTSQVGIVSGLADDAYFIFKKDFVAGNVAWEGALTSTCRANTLVDFGEANADQFTNAPEFFEIGMFDNNDVLIAYGTFPGETKTNLKSLNNLLRVIF